MKTLLFIGLILSIIAVIASIILGDLAQQVTWLLVTILISLEKSQVKS